MKASVERTAGRGSLEPTGCLQQLLSTSGIAAAAVDRGPSGTRPSQCLA